MPAHQVGQLCHAGSALRTRQAIPRGILEGLGGRRHGCVDIVGRGGVDGKGIRWTRRSICSGRDCGYREALVGYNQDEHGSANKIGADVNTGTSTGAGTGVADQDYYFLSPVQHIALRLGLRHFPVRLNISYNEHNVRARACAQLPADNGSFILTLVVASFCNTAWSASKIRGCDVLLAFAERLTDDAKLDRVLPYLMSLLNDKADMVVMVAVRTTTQLLALVRHVNPINAHITV